MDWKHKWTSIAMIVLLALTFPSVGNSQAGPPSTAPIRLQAATFNPGQGELPPIPPGLAIAGYAPNQRGYYIVQFQGPVQETWKAQVSALGGELLAYLPDFAFKVRMNPAQAARVERLASVIWVGLFQPAYKLSPEVNLEGQGLYRVRVEQGADAGLATAAIARSGAQVLERSGSLLLVGADGAQLQAIANVLDVAWVDNYVLPEKHNEYGAGVILGANVANANGYDGSSQIAAVSDTGLGDGTAAGAHPDIPDSRIVSINNWPGVATGCFNSISNDGPQDVDSGHGTHTALSVLGDGGASGEGKGTAPAAQLVFQATENWATISIFCQVIGGWPANGYFLTGLPDDLRDMYQQAYDDDARIHSNSWGSSLAGVYTTDSANTDDFIWNNPDMTITFSAGNAGVDANANGVVDNDSIGSPATAKNVITVGASEGDRQGNYQCDTNLVYPSHDAYQAGQTCSSMGGNQVNFLGTAGQRWGFSAEPLYSDVSAGNAQQMAPFSSRGPVDDGRLKPDVVAPGTWILSGFSGLYQEGYGDPINPQNSLYQWDGWGMPLNGAYKYMGGTSMSNPLAAGAATVVRDFYQKAYGHPASAALVKAALINSAVDLLDENNDGVNDNDYPIPNVHEGWGRLDLATATSGGSQYVDNTTGVGTGGSASYQFTVANAGQPFKVSLVWSDYPSSEVAVQNLVNNLNLVVTAPGGAQYRGNVFSGGWSQTGGSADGINNVENVYVQSAATGTWTVEVEGANVPQGPQPFALVVKYSAPAAVADLSITRDSANALLQWSHTDPDVTAYRVWRSSQPYFSPGDTGSELLGEVTPVGGSASYSDAGIIGAGQPDTYYTVQAVNIFGLVSPAATNVGKIEVTLQPGDATNKYTHLALPLDMSGVIDNAAGIATYIGAGIVRVLGWNPTAQGFTTHIVGTPINNFAVSPGDTVMVFASSAAPTSFAWVGVVPPAGSIQHTISGNGYSTFSLPLDQDPAIYADASDLAAGINANGGTVARLLKWNPVAQGFTTHIVGTPINNFAVSLGEPYWALNSTEVIWP